MSTRSQSPQADVFAYVKGNSKAILGAKYWETRYICRAEFGTKPEKLDARIVVVAKFRLFTLAGKSVTKLQVDGSHHVLAIKSIELESEQLMKFHTEDGKRFYLRVTHPAGNGARELAIELLKTLKHYFPGCNDVLKSILNLSPPELYAEFPLLPHSRPILPCDNFRRCYAAWCDYYRSPLRDEVCWDVEKIYASHSTTTLRLEDFTHLSMKDLVPIVAVLQYSSWFNGLAIENVKLGPELTEVILNVIKRTQRLNVLSLRNCGFNKEFIIALCGALDVNPGLPLEQLDLSLNSFDDHKSIIQLGNQLSRLTNAKLSQVVLSECQLNYKAANGLANGLFRAQLGHDTLTRLNLAGNHFKDDCNDVHNLLTHCAYLEHLDLSHTALPLEKIWNSLKYGGLRLRHLNLSGCSFVGHQKRAKDAAPAPTSLKDFFACAVGLRVVNLSDCHMTPECLKSLLMGLATNQDIGSLHLDLSRICAGSSQSSAVATVLEGALPHCRSITSLVLRDNDLDQDLLIALPAIGRMPGLRSLDVGGHNFVHLRKQPPQTLSQVLLEFVKIVNNDDSPVRDLTLSDCHLGTHLSVVLNALGVAPHLRRFDMQGNDVGNFGARLLAKALQLNVSLRTVVVDRNKIGPDGFADLAHALRDNSTLLHLPYPLSDAIELCRTGASDRHKAEQALLKIDKYLLRNRASSVRSPRRYADEDGDALSVGELSHHDVSSNSAAGGGAYDANSKQPLTPALRSAAMSADRSFHAQSRLFVTNLEEELNKSLFIGQEVLAGCGGSETVVANSEPALNVKALLDDVDRAKTYLSHIHEQPSAADRQFIDGLVAEMTERLEDEAQSQLRSVAGQIGGSVERQGYHLHQARPQLSPTLQELVARKLGQTDLRSPMDSLREQLHREFGGCVRAAAYGMIERVAHELLQCMHDAGKQLDTQIKSNSMNSLTSHTTPTTPKGKRAMRLFDRSSRPKSIINGETISDALQLSSDEREHGSGAFDNSIDSGGDDSARSLATGDDTDNDDWALQTPPTLQAVNPAQRLIAMQKSRPRGHAARRRPARNGGGGVQVGDQQTPSTATTGHEFAAPEFFAAAVETGEPAVVGPVELPSSPLPPSCASPVRQTVEAAAASLCATAGGGGGTPRAKEPSAAILPPSNSSTPLSTRAPPNTPSSNSKPAAAVPSSSTVDGGGASPRGLKPPPGLPPKPAPLLPPPPHARLAAAGNVSLAPIKLRAKHNSSNNNNNSSPAEEGDQQQHTMLSPPSGALSNDDIAGSGGGDGAQTAEAKRKSVLDLTARFESQLKPAPIRNNKVSPQDASGEV